MLEPRRSVESVTARDTATNTYVFRIEVEFVGEEEERGCRDEYGLRPSSVSKQPICHRRSVMAIRTPDVVVRRLIVRKNSFQ